MTRVQDNQCHIRLFSDFQHRLDMMRFCSFPYFYENVPFWEEDGQVHERYRIDGIVGHSIYFDHIVQKSDDEVWFALFSEGVDGTIQDWNQEWSFVYEDGQFKYGTVIRHDQQRLERVFFQYVTGIYLQMVKRR